jgi:hypothetical protein
MSAQERMKNAWALFAYTVLESGLDEALVAIFTGLSAIVEAITPLIKYLIGAVKGFIAMAKAVHAINLLIPILIGLLLAMSSSALIPFIGLVYGGVKALVMMQGAMATLAMGAGFLRTALMRLWPFLLIAGVIEAWSAFNGYLRGDRNWMSFLVGELMVVAAHVDLLGARLELLWAILRNRPTMSLDEMSKMMSGDVAASTKAPRYAFYDPDNPTQQAYRDQLQKNLPMWEAMFMSPSKIGTPQEMITAGMGQGSTLNIVLQDLSGNKRTIPVDLSTGQVVTIPIGGAATK